MFSIDLYYLDQLTATFDTTEELKNFVDDVVIQLVAKSDVLLYSDYHIEYTDDTNENGIIFACTAHETLFNWIKRNNYEVRKANLLGTKWVLVSV